MKTLSFLHSWYIVTSTPGQLALMDIQGPQIKLKHHQRVTRSRRPSLSPACIWLSPNSECGRVAGHLLCTEPTIREEKKKSMCQHFYLFLGRCSFSQMVYSKSVLFISKLLSQSDGLVSSKHVPPQLAYVYFVYF